MCSNLFTIPSQLFGVPVFGFGLLLLVWVVAGAIWAVRMSKKPGSKDELFAGLPVFALVAGAIIFLPRVFPEGFPVRGYGVMLVIAAISGMSLAYVRFRQAGLNPELLFSLAFWMFILGIVGGRVFYVVEYWETIYAPMPLGTAIVEALKYANGGLVVYGALFGAAAAFIWFARRHRLPMLALADMIAPSLVVGLAFGRIGCLLNGCCFGGVSDVPWAVTFPQQDAGRYSPPYAAQLASGEFYGMHLVERDGKVVVLQVLPDSAAAKAGIAEGDVVTHLAGVPIKGLDDAASVFNNTLNEEHTLPVRFEGKAEVVLAAAKLPPRSLPVHPTQWYGAVNAALLGWLLWTYYPFRRRDGEVIAMLLTLYPIARFLLEMIRVDEASFMGTGLSISQNVSIVLFVAAMALWAYLYRQPQGREFDPAGMAAAV
jgi:phosphatidylglycerol:prolipoprotein diacylglycerol transferase